jgi:serralysin
MGFWLKARDLNIEMDHIAGQFIIGKEFVTKFGVTQTDEQFINRLYDYVLHRPPLAEGLAFWTHALDVGVSREHVLAQFSVSAENRANVAELVANGIEYTPWHG